MRRFQTRPRESLAFKLPKKGLIKLPKYGLPVCCLFLLRERLSHLVGSHGSRSEAVTAAAAAESAGSSRGNGVAVGCKLVNALFCGAGEDACLPAGCSQCSLFTS